MLRSFGFLFFVFTILFFVAGGLAACGKSAQAPMASEELQVSEETDAMESERRTAMTGDTFSVAVRSALVSVTSTYTPADSSGLIFDVLSVAGDGKVYYRAKWVVDQQVRARYELVGTLRSSWIDRFHWLVNEAVPANADVAPVTGGAQGWFSTDEYGDANRTITVNGDDSDDTQIAKFYTTKSGPFSRWINNYASRTTIGTTGALLRIVRSMYPSAP